MSDDDRYITRDVSQRISLREIQQFLKISDDDIDHMFPEPVETFWPNPRPVERSRMGKNIRVPIQHIIDVAKVASELQARRSIQGVPVDGLHLVVEDGALTLSDRTGTFGTRLFDPA